MSEDLTPEERRAENRARHWAQRQQANIDRGPAGVTATWWDHARALARDVDRDGYPAIWEELTAALQGWCAAVEQRRQDADDQRDAEAAAASDADVA
ncbi:hypothetical protein ACFWIV_28935 [Streptomyces virginiae]|uniref:hypothetical protein n=1 Tax=Streptomyces virginiae TaxID=1961 RepID=UPI00365A494A